VLGTNALPRDADPWIQLTPSDVTSATAIVAGSAVLTYDYTPIPESSTALLVALGIVGMASVRRGRGTA
jgi:hypothetical protein